MPGTPALVWTLCGSGTRDPWTGHGEVDGGWLMWVPFGGIPLAKVVSISLARDGPVHVHLGFTKRDGAVCTLTKRVRSTVCQY